MASSSSLSDFVRFNDSVHFRKVLPTASSSSGNGQRASEPSLVLFLSWGGAPLRLVDKYTSQYASMFPQSPVLLVQTEFSHILRHTPRSQDAPLRPALKILHEHISTDSDRLLVHLFSNGGSYKLMEISKRYKAQHGKVLPIDTLILDSAPGISTLLRSFKAISYALPKPWFLKRPLQVLLVFGLLLQRLIERIFIGEGLMRRFRRQMNDPGLIDQKARRCYIFGPGDELVGWKDVQNHAADAKRKGYISHEEIFEGTAHVAHMRADPSRYWDIVKREWDAK